MRHYFLGSAAAAACILASCGTALAASCPGNPNALGVSRVLTIGPADLPRVGRLQYPVTLPLEDHEVVLTFDDGPLPPYTEQVLDLLAAECVKVTYFLVGRQANAFPEAAREVYMAGHAVGTHSQNHPLTFDKMPTEAVEKEIDDGIASVAAALGTPDALAPYFRIPGLMRSDYVEGLLATRSLMVWGIDFDADDWMHISSDQIVRRAMERLDKRGKGILLLHDIHPQTVAALPKLFAALKKGGYHVVQVVPPGERPQVLPDFTPMVAAPLPQHQRHARRVHVATAGEPPTISSFSAAPEKGHSRRPHHHNHRRHLARAGDDVTGSVRGAGRGDAW
ncbi:MAG TPA: polysaccharide deacetylase family protein [Pseudolabrys sp.]|nr:polysaccharide deacetylase family protein [Pseudolabrys sp.]